MVYLLYFFYIWFRSNFDKDFTNMPVAFTPIEAVIVKAINQDEFTDFSYQNLDWHCLERGELPKDDANEIIVK